MWVSNVNPGRKKSFKQWVEFLCAESDSACEFESYHLWFVFPLRERQNIMELCILITENQISMASMEIQDYAPCVQLSCSSVRSGLSILNVPRALSSIPRSISVREVGLSVCQLFQQVLPCRVF